MESKLCKSWLHLPIVSPLFLQVFPVYDIDSQFTPLTSTHLLENKMKYSLERGQINWEAKNVCLKLSKSWTLFLTFIYMF